jgi:outer membrane phospholipase A
MGRLFFDNLDFFLQGQLFSGYGESLLHYDRSDTRFRLGLAVYR